MAQLAKEKGSNMQELIKDDVKRKNYLSYFKLGAIDAIIKKKVNSLNIKSSAYYKKGWEFGQAIIAQIHTNNLNEGRK